MFVNYIDKRTNVWYNAVRQGKNKKRRRVAVINTNTPNYTASKEKHSHAGVIAYCDQCGFAIYSPDDALVVSATDDIIHTDCWEEYSAEHMFDFVVKASEKNDYSDT